MGGLCEQTAPFVTFLFHFPYFLIELFHNAFFEAGDIALGYAEQIGDLFLGQLCTAVQAEPKLDDPTLSRAEASHRLIEERAVYLILDIA